ncbi:MAG: CDGSH iron-sulfur domain-containing protein [Promethearchaeati archaeon SRVP18_Atabeyarchaeia-1]
MTPNSKNKNRKLGKQRIKVSENGPYLVSGGIPLFTLTICTDATGDPSGWRVGKKYPLLESYSLCRCGQSRNKPFCDGTHAKINFNGTETASREFYIKQAERMNGPDIELTDNRSLCSRVRFCHRAGGIWNLIPESGNSKARAMAIKEAACCASGRLVVWDKKTGKQIEPRFQKSIALVEGPQEGASGPIWVRGGIPIESADGSTYEIRNRVTLCRCGKSSNKPLCDGSHVSK